MKLMKTWVEGLDKTLGGLPSESVILLLGEPGSGHDLLAKQILYLHALREGKSVYFTTLKSDTILRENFADHGWKLEDLEKSKKWEFVDLRPSESIQVFREKVSSKTRDGRWTLMDSLSHLLMRQKLEQAFGVIETLLEDSRTQGGVHLLILTKGMHDAQTEIAVQEFVDGVLEFVLREVSGGIDSRIKVKKMKTIPVPKLIPFAITQQGITVETAVRI